MQNKELLQEFLHYNTRLHHTTGNNDLTWQLNTLKKAVKSKLRFIYTAIRRHLNSNIYF